VCEGAPRGAPAEQENSPPRAILIDVQSPLLVFDHVAKVAAVVQTGPRADKRLDEVFEAQQKQTATSGRPPR
jgi:hypothetical protein